MCIQQANVERSDKWVRVGEHNEYCAVDDGVVGYFRVLYDTGRLLGRRAVASDVFQSRVGDVELRNPGSEFGRRCGICRSGIVEVLWSNVFPCILPLEVNFTTWVGESSAVVSYSGTEPWGNTGGRIGNIQSREVNPLDGCIRRRAFSESQTAWLKKGIRWGKKIDRREESQ